MNRTDGEVGVKEQAAKDAALKARQLAIKRDATLKDKGKDKEKEERASKCSRKVATGQAGDISAGSSKPPSGAMVHVAPEGSKRKPVDGDKRDDAAKKLRPSSALVGLDHKSGARPQLLFSVSCQRGTHHK